MIRLTPHYVKAALRFAQDKNHYSPSAGLQGVQVCKPCGDEGVLLVATNGAALGIVYDTNRGADAVNLPEDGVFLPASALAQFALGKTASDLELDVDAPMTISQRDKLVDISDAQKLQRPAWRRVLPMHYPTEGATIAQFDSGVLHSFTRALKDLGINSTRVRVYAAPDPDRAAWVVPTNEWAPLIGVVMPFIPGPPRALPGWLPWTPKLGE